MKVVRWGILGAARVNERLMPAIIEAGNSKLIAIASRRPGAAADILAKYAPNETDVKAYDSPDLLLSNTDIEQLYEKYLYIDNFLRPIKSASNYKVDELIETAKKVNIYDNQKKYRKKELYDLIFNFVKWF